MRLLDIASTMPASARLAPAADWRRHPLRISLVQATSVRPTLPGGSLESAAVNDEDQLLRWLRRRLDRPLIGDDAAVLPAGGPFAVTVDSQVAGVHFIPGLDPACVAQRLLAVNLSDLAAMGAVPKYGFQIGRAHV